MFFKLFRLCCIALMLVALPMSAQAARDISAAEAAVEMQEPDSDWIIVDVRTPAEYERGHLEGSANANIGSEKFTEIIAPLNREDIYLVYCQTGKRSVKAVDTMEKMGFKKVIHMKDGMAGWQKANLPVTKE